MIIMYNLSLTFTKLSILLQYKRLFPQKGFKLAVHLVMGVVVIYALWRFFSAVFTCAPVQACELFFHYFFLLTYFMRTWGCEGGGGGGGEEDMGKPNADRVFSLRSQFGIIRSRILLVRTSLPLRTYLFHRPLFFCS